MQSAQFYKGMINGVEDCYESANLCQILPHNKLTELWDRERLGSYSRVFVSERVVAKTVITKAVPDDLGREGIINHTVLYKFDLYTDKDGVRYIFDADRFQYEANMGLFNFKMPPPPELKHPLEQPPILEVQK